MSNPFLDYGSSGGGIDITALQTGLTPINVSTIRDQSLIPGLPVAANSTKALVSRLIGTADLDFVPLSNPIPGNLTVNGALFANSVRTPAVTASANADVRINISSTAVNVLAPIFRFNGNDVATVVAIDQIVADAIAPVELKTQNIDTGTVPGLTTINGSLTLDGTLIANNVVSSGLDLNEFVTISTNKIIDLEMATNNITLFNDVTTIAGTLSATDLRANTIVDSATSAQLIRLDADGIDVLSSSFTFNGDDVATDASVAAAIAALPTPPITTLSSFGIGTSLINTGTGPDLIIKDLVPGNGITLTSDASIIEINTPTVTLSNAGGTSLVAGGIGPNLSTKGITAGTGITLSASASDVTINATAVSTTTLADAGGGISLVANGTGPALTVKSLSAGDGIAMLADPGLISVRVAPATLDRITAVETKTQNTTATPGETSFTGTLLLNQFTNIGDTLTNNGQRLTTLEAKTERINQPFTGVTSITGITDLEGTARVLLTSSDAFTVKSAGTSFDTIFNVNLNGIRSDIVHVFTAGLDPFTNLSSRIGTNIRRFLNIFAGTVNTLTLARGSAGPIVMGSDLDFGNVYNLLRCPSINGIRPSGGVYSESSPTTLTGVQTNTSIIGLSTGYGSTLVPANTFQPGDTYGLKIGGDITCSNLDEFSISVGTNGATPALFGTFNIVIDGAQTGGWWEIEIEFIVRAIGGAGVAQVSLNGNFMYYNLNKFAKGAGLDSLSGPTFSTLVDNTLRVTYTTAETTISLQPSQVSITKIF